MKKIKPLLIFIALLLGMAIFPYIPIELFHINVNKMSSAMKVTYNFICDIGLMIIVFLVYFRKTITEIKDYFKNFKDYFKVSIKYYIVGFILMFLTNLIITNYFSGASANNDNYVKTLIDMYPAYMLFSTIIYAPFIEETIFRRSIKDVVMAFGNIKITKYIYIIMSGLIFSLLHVVGMVNSSLDYLYIFPYMALGCAFAALYYKTDNLFTTIFLHSLHNLLALIIYFALGV